MPWTVAEKLRRGVIGGVSIEGALAMSNRRSTSRTRWVTCFTSLFLVGLLACIALGEISLGFNGQAELEYLRDTKTRLTPYTDESINVLRGHLDRLEAKGVPTPPLPPDGWTRQTTRSGDVASGRVTYHFDRVGLQWVQLVNFIDQLEVHFSIQSLDIRSRGSFDPSGNSPGRYHGGGAH